MTSKKVEEMEKKSEVRKGIEKAYQDMEMAYKEYAKKLDKMGRIYTADGYELEQKQEARAEFEKASREFHEKTDTYQRVVLKAIERSSADKGGEE